MNLNFNTQNIIRYIVMFVVVTLLQRDNTNMWCFTKSCDLCWINCLQLWHSYICYPNYVLDEKIVQQFIKKSIRKLK